MKLLDQLHETLRVMHYSFDTEQCYCQWTMRYLRYHHRRLGHWAHPAELGERGIEEFLSWLATQRRVAASTQNQALCALVFLYQRVLKVELGRFEATAAKRPQRLPVVLSRQEVGQVLARLEPVRGRSRHWRRSGCSTTSNPRTGRSTPCCTNSAA